jgi:hypothetical protein
MTMKTRRSLLLTLLAGFAFAAPAKAQFLPGTSPMDLSAQSRALTSSVLNRNAMRATARRGAAPRPTPARRPIDPSPSEVLSDSRFPFHASAALRQQVLNDFLGRVRRRSPEAARAIAAEFRRPAFQQSFANAVRSSGFSPDDAADVMAVYLVSGWEIVHGTDADLPAVRAVRRQVAGQMAGNAALRDPVTRAKFAEELKILVTLLGGSVENAKREGNAAQFAAGVAAHYRQAINRDLRAMQLTAQGFSGG